VGAPPLQIFKNRVMTDLLVQSGADDADFLESREEARGPSEADVEPALQEDCRGPVAFDDEDDCIIEQAVLLGLIEFHLSSSISSGRFGYIVVRFGDELVIL